MIGVDWQSSQSKASAMLTGYNERGVDELFSCAEKKQRRQCYLSPWKQFPRAEWDIDGMKEGEVWIGGRELNGDGVWALETSGSSVVLCHMTPNHYIQCQEIANFLLPWQRMVHFVFLIKCFPITAVLTLSVLYVETLYEIWPLWFWDHAGHRASQQDIIWHLYLMTLAWPVFWGDGHYLPRTCDGNL